MDKVEEEESMGISGTDDKLFIPIEDVELSVRSINCLKKAEIKYIGEVVQRTEQQLLDLENFGKTSLEEVNARLNEMGLSLGMIIDTEVFENEKERRSSESSEE